MAGMSFEEYVNAYYGGTLGIAKRYGIHKADDTFNTTGGDTSNTDPFNTMFGATVFNQLNTKSEVFKLLNKEAWTQSGWRALATRPTTTAGRAEGAAFQDTDKPEIKNLTAALKEIVTPYEVTTRAELLSEADDGIKGILNFLRKENAEAHTYYIDQMLFTDAGTQEGDNFESLDRATATLAYCTSNGTGHPNAQADADMYGIDISSNAWFDAGYTHFPANGTDDALALDDLDAGIATLLENGLDYSNLILVTGYDTYQDLKKLMQFGANANFNYDITGSSAGSQNGVTGEAGINFDSRVGAYDGIPIFVTQHAASDTSSRIYLLDTSAFALRIAAPTTYVDNQNLAILQKLSKEFAFITAGNLVTYRRNTSGSIRDLA